MIRLPLSITLLSLIATAAGAQPALILDLAGVAPEDGLVRRVYGASGNGAFGVPVAGGFDCDGDGLVDYAVAYMTADAFGRFRAGEVDLVFGDGTTGGIVDTFLDDPGVLRIAGAGERENAGSEIWMDDVTGDGIADLLICRQNHSPSAQRIGAGALTILAGGAPLRGQAKSLETVDLAAPPPGLTLTTFIGAGELDRLGIWARTGDVTGDGIADIVVGADQEDGPGEDDRGAVYVIRGGPHLAGGGTVDLAQAGALDGHLAHLTPPPGATGYHLGGTCQIADLDGNGRAEVLAAATLNRAGASLPPDGAPPGSTVGSGGAPDGTLYIAWDDNFPAGLWPAGYTIDLSAAPGGVTAINGETLNRNFGEELLGGLDYDADGHADLFVGDLLADGSPGSDRPSSGVGYVFYRAADLRGLDFDLETPPPGLPLTRILGPQSGAIGGDTAAHGDVDGDGLADLAFASPHASPAGRASAGAVHVLYGRTGGWPAIIDLAEGAFPSPDDAAIAEIRGALGSDGPLDTGDTLGYSAAAGDVDGDGLIDLVINEMVGNGLHPGTRDVGNLIITSGAALRRPAIFIDGFESGDTTAWTAPSPEKVR